MKIRRLKQFENDYFITDDNGIFIDGPRFTTHEQAKDYLKSIKNRPRITLPKKS